MPQYSGNIIKYNSHVMQAGAGEGAAAMLQLPHFDADVLKKLSRKKVRGPGDLLSMTPPERLVVLRSVGMITFHS